MRPLASRVALPADVGAAAATGAVAPDEVVDERSGLTAADFDAAVEVFMVRSTQPAGQTPYFLIGRVREPEETQ